MLRRRFRFINGTRVEYVISDKASDVCRAGIFARQDLVYVVIYGALARRLKYFFDFRGGVIGDGM